jgi:hypothetical protein
LHAHDRVIDAIRIQDENAASRRMHSHLHAFRLQAISEKYPADLTLSHHPAPAASSSPTDPTNRKTPPNQTKTRTQTRRRPTK